MVPIKSSPKGHWAPLVFTCSSVPSDRRFVARAPQPHFATLHAAPDVRVALEGHGARAVLELCTQTDQKVEVDGALGEKNMKVILGQLRVTKKLSLPKKCGVVSSNV